MGPLLVVEGQISPNPLSGLSPILVCLQVHLLVLDAAPQPFHEDVVHAPAPAVHAHLNALRQWRRLRDDHPNDGRSLSWLVTEERILNLELAMAEERGLALPPETQPLAGVWRNGQRRSIEAALGDTRWARTRRERLRWVRRFFTGGLWWK